jgi:hypothetical protein
MGNWSSNTITLVGNGTPEILNYINSHLEPIPHPITNDPWVVYVDIAPLIAVRSEDLRGGLNLYHEHVPLKPDEKGATEFGCQTKGEPPLDALGRLTTQYPGLTATIIWGIELEFVTRGVRIVNGQITVVRDGDFVLAEHGEPVHHWSVEALTPEAKAAIEAADVNVLVPSSRWSDFPEGFPRPGQLRLRNSEIAKVKSIAGVTCAPWTLDERTFLSGLNPDIYPTGVDYDEAARWVKLCERRRVALTPQEIEAVRQKARAVAGTPDAVSFHEEDRYTFYPTAQEIAWLLPLSTEERRKELQAALDTPEWTARWPDWQERSLAAVLGGGEEDLVWLLEQDLREQRQIEQGQKEKGNKGG